MIALIYRLRAELPDGRALLYGFITDAYLGTLDKERGLGHLRPPIPHSVEEMRAWLAAVGWHLRRRRGEQNDAENEILLNRNELLKLLAKISDRRLAKMPASLPTFSLNMQVAAVDYFSRAGRTPPAVTRTPSSISLFKNTLRPTSCATASPIPTGENSGSENRRDGCSLTDLRRYAGDNIWRETLIFLWESAALINPVLPQRLLVRLFNWQRDESLWGD